MERLLIAVAVTPNVVAGLPADADVQSPNPKDQEPDSSEGSCPNEK